MWLIMVGGCRKHADDSFWQCMKGNFDDQIIIIIGFIMLDTIHKSLEDLLSNC